MNLAEAPAAVLNPSAVVAAVTRVADGPLAKAATRIDREGYYPLAEMRQLAEAGAFGAHLDRNGTDVATALDAMRAISRRCGSTGFLAWCHDVCGLYMEQSGNPALTGQLLTDHAAGLTFGGTALSNPMKSFAGIENMLLKAEKVPGGYRVSGALPWVSHIAPGQYCGAIARVSRADGSRSHEIMFLLRFEGEQAVLRQCPEFSGMEGTSTWGVRLDNYFVGEDSLIADPAQPFIAKIRGAFILLQCGMAMGVVQGAIDSMLEVEPLLGHVNKFLHDRPDELQAEYEELGARIFKLAETPYDGSRDYLLDVLDVRAAGAELSLRATQSALLHQGARGYLMDSAPQRRIREAHFVAIVTPAIKHLRWEMDRLSREETPA
ncbi:MAG: acyl-CoA/acyl-ACP dehydrogenase [Pseudazoarcus pumilus]|nr:acyl-CoA/acyl-ACP dehydrogenase [Pseudazoarcus pumilus]